MASVVQEVRGVRAGVAVAGCSPGRAESAGRLLTVLLPWMRRRQDAEKGECSSATAFSESASYMAGVRADGVANEGLTRCTRPRGAGSRAGPGARWSRRSAAAGDSPREAATCHGSAAVRSAARRTLVPLRGRARLRVPRDRTGERGDRDPARHRRPGRRPDGDPIFMRAPSRRTAGRRAAGAPELRASRPGQPREGVLDRGVLVRPCTEELPVRPAHGGTVLTCEEAR